MGYDTKMNYESLNITTGYFEDNISMEDGSSSDKDPSWLDEQGEPPLSSRNSRWRRFLGPSTSNIFHSGIPPDPSNYVMDEFKQTRDNYKERYWVGWVWTKALKDFDYNGDDYDCRGNNDIPRVPRG